MTVWHQTRPKRGLLDVADPARFPGRYHRAGGPGVWYASKSERGAWAELFRHWEFEDVSPFEVRRRVGRARANDLEVLDLCDPDVQDQLGLSKDQLIDDDLFVCQAIAEGARQAGFDAILAPSAALPGERTLAVFSSALHKVEAEHSRIQRPPIRMLDVLEHVRVPASVAESVGRLYEALRRLGRRLRG